MKYTFKKRVIEFTVIEFTVFEFTVFEFTAIENRYYLSQNNIYEYFLQ
jgi:hypothetical protein